jgi:hypothetical protein
MPYDQLLVLLTLASSQVCNSLFCFPIQVSGHSIDGLSMCIPCMSSAVELSIFLLIDINLRGVIFTCLVQDNWQMLKLSLFSLVSVGQPFDILK